MKNKKINVRAAVIGLALLCASSVAGQGFSGKVVVACSVADNTVYDTADCDNGKIVTTNLKGELDSHDGLLDYRDIETGLWGIADTTGRVIFPPQYDFISKWTASVVKVHQENKSWLVDLNGKRLDKTLLQEYAEIEVLVDADELANPRKGIFYGPTVRVPIKDGVLMIDRDAIIKEVTEDFNARFAQEFAAPRIRFDIDDDSSPLQRFSSGFYEGYYDKTGRIVIAPRFDACYLFYNNSSRTYVEEDGAVYLIDRTGKVLEKTNYSPDEFFNDLALPEWESPRYILNDEEE